MKSLPLIVLSTGDRLEGYDGPSVDARAFLEAPGESEQVVNLCRSWEYLSEGYYVSLLAEARGREVSPTPALIAALGNPRRILRALDQAGVPVVDLSADPERPGVGLPGAFVTQDGAPLWLRQRSAGVVSYRRAEAAETARVVVALGRCADASFRAIARAAHRVWPLPLMELRLLREERKWKIVALAPLSFADLDAEGRAELTRALERYAKAGAPSEAPRPRASLALLFDDNDIGQPSSPETLDRFSKVAASLGLHVHRIGPRDIGRLAEFDALFIRALTGPDLPTFAFALQAESLAMPVIDSPTSILRCSNKVYLHELLTRAGVPQPETRIASQQSRFEELAEALGSPFVVKLPDGSFSTAVFKIDSPEAYEARARPLLERSPLVLAQRFTPTAFDWRIAVLGGEPLFAARYHMARGHWQIASATRRGPRYGKVEAVALGKTPPAVLEVATRAAGLIGDGLYGVDLKELPSGEVVVIEVNDNPNIDVGYEDAVEGDAVYRRLAEYFLARITERFEGRPQPATSRRLQDEELLAWRTPIVCENTAKPPYAPFSVCGLELEFALVDRDLNVASLAAPTLASLAGQTTSEVELGIVGLTNEIVEHVLELRTDLPLPSLHDTESVLVEGVRRVGALLATRHGGARLLPTAMHPWLDPRRAKLWRRSHRRIYETYERLFDTATHGWRNVQSCHVNLPLGDEQDAVDLLNATSLIIPYLPALAASSPLLEGELGDAVCNRLAHILTHQVKIPETQGQLVPEWCESLSGYRRDILEPMFEAIDRLPDSKAIRGDFLNARGAVIKFVRNSLEVRVLDTQECVKLDVAIASFTRWALAQLAGELRRGTLERPPHAKLVEDLHACVQSGSEARVWAPHLPELERDAEGRASVQAVLEAMRVRATQAAPADEQDYLELVGRMIPRGSLSEAIRAQLLPLVDDDDAFTETARRIYIELADCLLENEPWSGRGLG